MPRATTSIHTLSLHDALPISQSLKEGSCRGLCDFATLRLCDSAPTSRPDRPSPRRPEDSSPPYPPPPPSRRALQRSEEHTAELPSRREHVSRPLLAKIKEKRS